MGYFPVPTYNGAEVPFLNRPAPPPPDRTKGTLYPDHSLPPISSTERERAMPAQIPYNASLDEQNLQQPNLRMPSNPPLLNALRASGLIDTSNNDAAVVAPWVAAGGRASDFAPQVGPGVGIMPMAAREAIRNHPNPWVGLGGSESDYYDAHSPQEMQRQSDNAQFAKLRRIQQIFAPPSQASIEQTMQNSAMGYAPEYQRAYLQDMQSRTSDRLAAAARAISDLYGQDVGMRAADVQENRTGLEAGVAGQAMQQEALMKMLGQEGQGLPPDLIKQLQQMMLQKIMVRGAR